MRAAVPWSVHTLALDQLASVRGGEKNPGERAMAERFKKELQVASPTQKQKFYACLDANQPRKDVDDITWPEAMRAFLKCEREALAK